MAILFYLCPKSYRFLGVGLGAIDNMQEFRDLFLVNEIVTTYLGLLYWRFQLSVIRIRP